MTYPKIQAGQIEIKISNERQKNKKNIINEGEVDI